MRVRKMDNKQVEAKLTKIQHYSTQQSVKEDTGTKWEDLSAEQLESRLTEINRNIIISEN